MRSEPDGLQVVFELPGSLLHNRCRLIFHVLLTRAALPTGLSFLPNFGFLCICRSIASAAVPVICRRPITTLPKFSTWVHRRNLRQNVRSEASELCSRIFGFQPGRLRTAPHSRSTIRDQAAALSSPLSRRSAEFCRIATHDCLPSNCLHSSTCLHPPTCLPPSCLPSRCPTVRLAVPEPFLFDPRPLVTVADLPAVVL